MALYSEIDTLKPLLESIDGVKRVTEGWPNDFNTLPCVALDEAANLIHSTRDDVEYTTTLEYNLRVFGYDASVNRRIASDADTVMVAQGYLRTFKGDSNTEDTRQCVSRYQKTLGTQI